jgi:putative flavoprotein involved in K+ transport
MSTTAAVPVVAAVERWLSRFDEALTRGDSAVAAELFGHDSYWRDLVAFTWNITTVEGRAGVRHMLEHTLSRTQPHGWRVAEEPVALNGVGEAWLAFETAVGRGRGYLRLRDGRAWTLLTTLEELRGHEESVGPHRPKGVEHGAIAERRTWFEERSRESEELGYTAQPYVVIVAGGRAGSRSERACVHFGSRRSSSSATRDPAIRGATGTSRSVCTILSGTTICRTSSSPKTGRCSRPRTRSPTGSRCTRA